MSFPVTPNFVWIIPLDKASALGKGGISPSYIIPQNHLLDLPKNLMGAHIWIVIRGSLDRCVAIVTPKRIERFLEGYYNGDFLITSNLSKSLRLTQDYDGARGNEIEFTRQFGWGINEISDSSSKELFSLIERGIQVKLMAPPIRQLSNVKLPTTTKKPETFILAALASVTLNFSLDQIWGSGTGQRLTPISNFALQLLKINNRELPVEMGFLQVNDPVNNFLQHSQPVVAEVSRTLRGQSKSVDLDFTNIDPDKIYAREFILSNLLPLNLEDALNKTEVAEKLHQDMLRDISQYLLRIGAMPYESSSIDLMTEYQGRTKIFEIKSTNNNNVISQCAKGAFQIACYLNAMTPDYEPLDAALILHKIDNMEIQDFAVQSLSLLGINCLIYDPLLNWPNRVRNLLTTRIP
jgi:hypothetical protein